MGHDRRKYSPLVFSDLPLRAFLSWQDKIPNAMGIADRNVISVVKRRLAETVY